jgi:SAM-dependent methyltransferase/GNAT superfamily N-acetyltransferase
MTAVDRWREQLESWAIPADILARAPASPYGFSVDVFSRIADDAVARPPDVAARRALEVLADGDVVLDVGCGAGAAGLPLASRAGRLVGVDESPDLLAAFAVRAERLGVDHLEVRGRWPDIAGEVPAADVVVCRHVAYNVPDLDPFLARLTDHARRRVVLHLTTEHPLAWTTPYWERLHGVGRPAGPTVEDAVAVAREVAVEPSEERWSEPFDLGDATLDDQVAFLGRRLCLGQDRDEELRRALAEIGVPGPRPVATLWWPGTAPGREAVHVRAVGAADREWVGSTLASRWGLPVITTSGSYPHPERLEGVIAEVDGRPVGAATYRIDGAGCEVVTLLALERGLGAGRLLMEAVRAAALQAGVPRVWLLTTDDNTGAIGFYEHIGMTRVRVIPAFIEVVRAVKPEIPPSTFTDSIEFEWRLGPD